LLICTELIEELDTLCSLVAEAFGNAMRSRPHREARTSARRHESQHGGVVSGVVIPFPSPRLYASQRDPFLEEHAGAADAGLRSRWVVQSVTTKRGKHIAEPEGPLLLDDLKQSPLPTRHTDKTFTAERARSPIQSECFAAEGPYRRVKRVNPTFLMHYPVFRGSSGAVVTTLSLGVDYIHAC